MCASSQFRPAHRTASTHLYTGHHDLSRRKLVTIRPLIKFRVRCECVLRIPVWKVIARLCSRKYCACAAQRAQRVRSRVGELSRTANILIWSLGVVVMARRLNVGLSDVIGAQTALRARRPRTIRGEDTHTHTHRTSTRTDNVAT